MLVTRACADTCHVRRRPHSSGGEGGFRDGRRRVGDGTGRLGRGRGQDGGARRRARRGSLTRTAAWLPPSSHRPDSRRRTPRRGPRDSRPACHVPAGGAVWRRVRRLSRSARAAQRGGWRHATCGVARGLHAGHARGAGLHVSPPLLRPVPDVQTARSDAARDHREQADVAVVRAMHAAPAPPLPYVVCEQRKVRARVHVRAAAVRRRRERLALQLRGSGGDGSSSRSRSSSSSSSRSSSRSSSSLSCGSVQSSSCERSGRKRP